jgi:hypothetical protein
MFLGFLVMSQAIAIIDPQAPGTQIELAATGQLITIESVFRPGGAQAVIAAVKALVEATEIDVSTDAGRKAAGRLRDKISGSKAALDSAGKDLKAAYQRQIDPIDAERKAIRDQLDALRDQVDAPLVAYKNREAKRAAAHEAAIAEMLDHGPLDTSAQVAARLAALPALAARDWEEFELRAARTLRLETAALTEKLAEITAAEAAKAERERLAAEAKRVEAERLEQERIAREAEIARQAAERAQQEAEAKAEAERLAVLRETKRREEAAAKAAADALRQEQERAAAILRQQQEAAAAVQDQQRKAVEAEQRRAAEAERKAAEELAAAAAREAAQRARAAAAEQQAQAAREQAQRDADAAVEAERQRVAAAAEAEYAAAQERLKDREHRRVVNTEAMTDIIAAGVPDKAARAVVAAISKGTVRHVVIKY